MKLYDSDRIVGRMDRAQMSLFIYKPTTVCYIVIILYTNGNPRLQFRMYKHSAKPIDKQQFVWYFEDRQYFEKLSHPPV